MPRKASLDSKRRSTARWVSASLETLQSAKGSSAEAESCKRHWIRSSTCRRSRKKSSRCSSEPVSAATILRSGSQSDPYLSFARIICNPWQQSWMSRNNRSDPVRAVMNAITFATGGTRCSGGKTRAWLEIKTCSSSLIAYTVSWDLGASSQRRIKRRVEAGAASGSAWSTKSGTPSRCRTPRFLEVDKVNGCKAPAVLSRTCTKGGSCESCSVWHNSWQHRWRK
mmetsp:Transcript_35844/g.85839  ORF Transcript_35844/g.85839 Transcript_35844/m.85839 type:complete len:225 (+) Transcript_35844:311-985(+)